MARQIIYLSLLPRQVDGGACTPKPCAKFFHTGGRTIRCSALTAWRQRHDALAFSRKLPSWWARRSLFWHVTLRLPSRTRLWRTDGRVEAQYRQLLHSSDVNFSTPSCYTHPTWNRHIPNGYEGGRGARRRLAPLQIGPRWYSFIVDPLNLV